MAKIKGICKNYGECDLADEKVIQEAEKSNYICEECGKPLYAVDTPKKNGIGGKVNGKLIGIIAAAVLLLGGIGFGIYSLFGGKPEPTAIKLSFTNLTMTVGEQKQLTASLLPEKADQKVTFIYKAQKDQAYKDGKEKTKIVEADNSTGMLTAMRPGNTTAQVVCKEWPKLVAVCNITVREAEPKEPVTDTTKLVKVDTVLPQAIDGGKKAGGGGKVSPSVNPPRIPKYGTVRLSYGTYKGELSKDGKPNGHGTITYSCAKRIVSSYDYVAQPGDTYEGDFRNGVISGGFGYWKHNGETVTLRP